MLLDLSFRAKVGDFGLARALNEVNTQYQSQTHRVVGTSGYIAPEYYHGTITTKLDTYAFGVVSIIMFNLFTTILVDIIRIIDRTTQLRSTARAC